MHETADIVEYTRRTGVTGGDTGAFDVDTFDPWHVDVGTAVVPSRCYVGTEATDAVAA